jgi:hypothetical protein
VERLGPAWVRLTPYSPLDAGEQYYLMAGPGREIPLRIAQGRRSERVAADSSAPKATVDVSGRLYLKFGTPIHPFSIDHETLVLLDREGRQVPYEARVTEEGLTVTIDGFGQTSPCRI